MARGLPGLALEAVAYPPSGANVHPDPPVEALQHVKGPMNAEVARSVRIAGVHDPRAYEERDVNADGMVTGRVRWVVHQEYEAVIVGVKAALSSEYFDVAGVGSLGRWQVDGKVWWERRG